MPLLKTYRLTRNCSTRRWIPSFGILDYLVMKPDSTNSCRRDSPKPSLTLTSRKTSRSKFGTLMKSQYVNLQETANLRERRSRR